MIPVVMSSGELAERTDRYDSPVSVRRICFYFLLGSVAGALYQRLYDNLNIGAYVLKRVNALSVFNSAALPFFLILFLSTSVIGCYILPFVYISRGFVLSVQAFCLLDSSLPIVSIAGLIGIPAVLSLCSLLIIGRGSFSCAQLLRSGVSSSELKTIRIPVLPGLILTFASALSRLFLSPAFM